ncbi:MAG TPA: DUF1521 domain-containing protein [Myxococcales bacterium LLY-WYZ-16_1]|nr:DUF1521 domain-containing protein [Myxococcales bacterium LLY-WYZ-16_1]
MTTVHGSCHHPQVQFNFYGNQVHTGYDASMQAADMLRRLIEGATFRPPPPTPQLPPSGALPPPRMDLSGVPAGRGLSTQAPEGWPEDTITTAGGYKIVPTGERSAWEIYAPDQEHCDKPMTRVWGDPHVDEGDGTRWDFTKDGDFILPDGTRIHCDTTSQTGRSVSQNLTIWNGNDRVEVTGINSNDPQVSQVYHDGYRTRAEHMAQSRDMFSFYLTGDSEDQQWVRATSGELEGVITGAYYDNQEQVYKQRIDEGNIPQVALGSEGWGNGFRSAVLDHQIDQFMDMAEAYYGPEVADWLGGQYAARYGAAMEMNHQQHMFGGWYDPFPTFDHGWNAVMQMHDLLLSDHLFRNHTDHVRFIDRGVLR